MHNRKRIMVPIVVVLAAAALAAWYWTQNNAAAAGGDLDASGTVEAVEVSISPELSGRVVDVLVDQGQAVTEGEALLRLDDTLLKSQRLRAEAGVHAAQENLATAQVGLTAAEAGVRVAETALEAANANAQAELVGARQALDALYENTGLARADAVRKVAAANRARRDAEYLWENYTIPSTQKDLTAMEAISVTWQILEQARADFEPYRNEDSGNDRREELKEVLDEAQSEYDTAVRRMELETAVEQARQTLDKAIRDLEELSDGPDPDEVIRLEARIDAIEAAPKQAQAAVDQARVGLEQAQAKLKQADAALAQAQAELDLIDVQIEKLTAYAPTTGVVLARVVEPGEVVQAGAALLRLGQLDRLKITVFVPEDRYGQITLGQAAQVAVDSFPGQNFNATVTHIADQAEFTPRNVQTSEGRKTTVFAVELSIENPDGRLKPGMPADVSFGQ
jgi:HlyD family secretion protein